MENEINNVDMFEMETDILKWLEELEKTNFSEFLSLLRTLVNGFDNQFSKYDMLDYQDMLNLSISTGEVKSFRDLI